MIRSLLILSVRLPYAPLSSSQSGSGGHVRSFCLFGIKIAHYTLGYRRLIQMIEDGICFHVAFQAAQNKALSSKILVVRGSRVES